MHEALYVVMTSEFIVVRMEVETLIWSENRPVHACVWLIVKSSSFFFFSGKSLARLLLLHEKGPEPCLEDHPKARRTQSMGVVQHAPCTWVPREGATR